MSEVLESRCAASGPGSQSPALLVASPAQSSFLTGNYFMSSCPCHSHLRCAATLYRSTSSSSLSA